MRIVLKFMQMLNRLFIPHPPKNFFIGLIVGKDFDISRGPASPADYGNFIFSEWWMVTGQFLKFNDNT